MTFPLDGHEPAAEAAPVMASLTPAEQSIVAAVLQGQSNAAIARERGTSPRTIANQLAAMYRKLGVSSRRELGASMRSRSG